ncbi:hypothetical protein SAMN05421831_10892 [Allopseudospirillum japonicum]|uniref:DNA repair protein n=1 Tax=Allopseudospirillum japonicum TaxID=64971 RepID=A0A1H6T6Z8_9GAMM|nr:hypothetical protein [Allopseudospirillum japonicum]SEI72015.1 hypothetical protein SAMN05421831_10892 [Allopseudospirillum japonicum]
MTITTIALLGGSLVIALGMIFFVYARQRAEQKRIERARRVRLLGDRARQLQFLIDEIPPHYLDHDFRIFLARQVVDFLREQSELDPKDARAQKNLDAAEEHALVVESGKNLNNKPITDIQTANVVRRNLKNLHKYILGQYQDRKIPQVSAQSYLKQIKSAFTKSILEVYSHAAETAQNAGKLRVAIIHYKRIINELNKQNAAGEYNDTILNCKRRIDRLEQEVAMQEANAKNQNNQLSQGLDKMLEEEDTWKKKQVYD